MDVPPPAPPSRDAPDDHGYHDRDDALVSRDGLILNGVDSLVDTLIGLAASMESGSGEVDVAHVLKMVNSNWFQTLHPLVYERLARLKELEASGRVDVPEATNESQRIRQLEFDLGQALRMTELANKSNDAQNATIANLERKLDNANTLLGVAQSQLGQRKKEVAELEATMVAMNTRIKMAEGSKRGLQDTVTRLNAEVERRARLEQDLRERLALVEDLSVADQEARARGARPVAVITDARLGELEDMVRSMHEEIRELEEAKADLEVQLVEARQADERVERLVTEKEELSGQLEVVEEQRDVAKDELQEVIERESESASEARSLQEEVETLRRRLEDMEAEGQDPDNELYGELKMLRTRVRELEREKEEGHASQANRDPSGEHSAGATRGEGDRMTKRARDLEEAAALMARTNERLLVQVQEQQERLADLEEENRLMRYVREQDPSIPSSSASPARAAAARTSPDRGATASEVDRLQAENDDLRLQLIRAKKTKAKSSDEELQAQLTKAEEILAKAESDLAALVKAIATADEKRKAGLRLKEWPPGTPLSVKEDYNREQARINYDSDLKTEEMRIQLTEQQARIAPLKGKVTKLRKQIALRQEEYRLTEEASKRNKRTEARIPIAARAMVV